MCQTSAGFWAEKLQGSQLITASKHIKFIINMRRGQECDLLARVPFGPSMNSSALFYRWNTIPLLWTWCHPQGSLFAWHHANLTERVPTICHYEVIEIKKRGSVTLSSFTRLWASPGYSVLNCPIMDYELFIFWFWESTGWHACKVKKTLSFSNNSRAVWNQFNFFSKCIFFHFNFLWTPFFIIILNCINQKACLIH